MAVATTDPIAPIEGLFNSQETVIDGKLALAVGIRVASDTERASKFTNPPPQFAKVIRTDKGDMTEIYYGLYNATTNVYGARVAGWYPAPGSNIRSRAFKTASQTGGTNAVVTYSSSDHIGGGSLNSSQGLVAPVGGEYMVKANLRLSGGSAASDRILSFYKNSVSVANQIAGDVRAAVIFDHAMNISADVVLAAGEQVYVVAIGPAGGTIHNVASDAAFTAPVFTMQYVRPPLGV